MLLKTYEGRLGFLRFQIHYNYTIFDIIDIEDWKTDSTQPWASVVDAASVCCCGLRTFEGRRGNRSSSLLSVRLVAALHSSFTFCATLALPTSVLHTRRLGRPVPPFLLLSLGRSCCQFGRRRSKNSSCQYIKKIIPCSAATPSPPSRAL